MLLKNTLEGSPRQSRIDSSEPDIRVSGNKRIFQQNILRLLTDSQLEPLFDVIIAAEGKEFQAHRCILAAASNYFQQLFCSPDPPTRIEFQQQWQVVQQLLRSIYGAPLDTSLEPEVVLEVLSEARNLEVDCVTSEPIDDYIIPYLSVKNCIALLLHEELPLHLEAHKAVADFVARSFIEFTQTPSQRHQLLQLSRSDLISIIRGVAGSCNSSKQAEAVVRLAVDWSQFASACDLLRDCKQWSWASDPNGFSDLAAITDDGKGSCYGERNKEWHIDNVKQRLQGGEDSSGGSMLSLPVRYVCGQYCNWSVRIDHGAEGKIRLVYEAAVDNHPERHSCIQRFPAAMFAWQVMFRGANVFHERPVFICFPKNVSLHWSTTLPISVSDLTDTDDITIMVQMVENPLVSLVLYHFSSDISNTVNTEDILNRLPHIEYRCLSSYSLFQKKEVH